MKYIDAERLRAEIERRLKSLHEWKIGWERRLPLQRNKTYYKHLGKESAYDAILSIITSLQQEQPEVDFEKEIDVFFYGKNFKRCFDGVRVPGMLMRDWQNQNVSRSLNTDEIRGFARHFYELGINARKED